jgi:hypothetical protein
MHKSRVEHYEFLVMAWEHVRFFLKKNMVVSAMSGEVYMQHIRGFSEETRVLESMDEHLGRTNPWGHLVYSTHLAKIRPCAH